MKLNDNDYSSLAEDTNTDYSSLATSTSASKPKSAPTLNRPSKSGLDPDFESKVQTLQSNLAAQGIKTEIRSGLRSSEEQAKLYARRNPVTGLQPNGLPVARPGTSMHEKGLAVDIVPVGKDNRVIRQKIGEEGERLGLTWGGRFKKKDPPHFSYNPKTKTVEQTDYSSLADNNAEPTLNRPAPATSVAPASSTTSTTTTAAPTPPSPVVPKINLPVPVAPETQTDEIGRPISATNAEYKQGKAIAAKEQKEIQDFASRLKIKGKPEDIERLFYGNKAGQVEAVAIVKEREKAIADAVAQRKRAMIAARNRARQEAEKELGAQLGTPEENQQNLNSLRIKSEQSEKAFTEFVQKNIDPAKLRQLEANQLGNATYERDRFLQKEFNRLKQERDLAKQNYQNILGGEKRLRELVKQKEQELYSKQGPQHPISFVELDELRKIANLPTTGEAERYTKQGQKRLASIEKRAGAPLPQDARNRVMNFQVGDEVLSEPETQKAIQDYKAREQAARKQVLEQVGNELPADYPVIGDPQETVSRLTDERLGTQSPLDYLEQQRQATEAENARKQRVAQMTWGEYLAQAPKSAILGVTDTVANFIKAAPILAKNLDFSGNNLSVEEHPIYRLGKFIEEGTRELFGSNKDLEAEFGVGKIPSSVTQLIPFMFGAWTTNAPKLTIAIMGGTVTAADAYEEVRQMGGSEDEAVRAALVAGALLGPTELIGMNGALDAISNPYKKQLWRIALKRALKEGRRDMVENALQEMGQEYAQGRITGKNRTLQEVLEAGSLGAIASAPVTTGLHLISNVNAPSTALPTPAENTSVESQLDALNRFNPNNAQLKQVESAPVIEPEQRVGETELTLKEQVRAANEPGNPRIAVIQFQDKATSKPAHGLIRVEVKGFPEVVDYNPRKSTRTEVENAIREGRTNELKGAVVSEEVARAGENPQIVIGRNETGTEVSADIVPDESLVPAQEELTQQQVGETGTVETEPLATGEQKIVRERLNNNLAPENVVSNEVTLEQNVREQSAQDQNNVPKQSQSQTLPEKPTVAANPPPKASQARVDNLLLSKSLKPRTKEAENVQDNSVNQNKSESSDNGLRGNTGQSQTKTGVNLGENQTSKGRREIREAGAEAVEIGKSYRDKSGRILEVKNVDDNSVELQERGESDGKTLTINRQEFDKNWTKTVHKFSSTQVNLPSQAANEVRGVGKKLIRESDLYTDPNDPSYGREKEPHITVKYGLHTENADEVRAVLADETPIRAKLGKISIFPAKGDTPYDVVKADVISQDLHRVNAKIAENTKVTDTHPEYKPHVTLAYVKKGEGKKYVGDKSLIGKEFTFDSIAFSSSDGKQVEIPLGKNQAQNQVEPTKTTVQTTAGVSAPVKAPPENIWNMTRAEFMRERESAGDTTERTVLYVQHRRAVRNAIEKKLDVPNEVLKDYPELLEEFPEVAKKYRRETTPRVMVERKRRQADPNKHSLWEFVQLSGGIKPTSIYADADGKAINELRKLSQKESGKPFLINKNSKYTVEQMGQLAAEAGYPVVREGKYGFDDTNDIDPNAFIEMVEDDAKGVNRVYSSQNEAFVQIDEMLSEEEAYYREKEERLLEAEASFTRDPDVIRLFQGIESTGEINDDILSELNIIGEIYGLEPNYINAAAESLADIARTRLETETDAGAYAFLDDGEQESGYVFAEEPQQEPDPEELALQSLPETEDDSFDFADEEADSVMLKSARLPGEVHPKIGFPERRIRAEIRNFSKDVDAVIDGTAKRGDVPEVLSSAPPLLRRFELIDASIVMPQQVVKKAIGETGRDHNIAPETLKMLPAELNNPVMVFGSFSDDNALMVLTELDNREGFPVVVAIKYDGEIGGDKLNVIPSAHEKNRAKFVLDWQSKLLYANKEKSQRWFQKVGLQLPETETILAKPNIITYEQIVNNPDSLKMARTPDAEKAIDALQETGTDDLLLGAVVARDKDVISLNGQAYEIIRRALNDVKFARGGTTQSLLEEAPFDGLFLRPTDENGNKELPALIAAVKKAARVAESYGYSSKEVGVFNNIAQELQAAQKEGQGTAIIKVFDDALSHESFHQGSYLGSKGTSLEKRHSEKTLDTLYNHAASKAWLNKFGNLPEYQYASKGLVVEETAATIADGSHERLGISKEEAVDYLTKWATSYVETNGPQAVQHFRRTREDVKQILENARTRFETAKQSRNQIVNDAQRSRQGESDNDSGEVQRQPRNETENDSQTSGRTEEKVSASINGKQRLRSLPETLREQGLYAADELYNVYGDKAASIDARHILETQGFEGAVELLRTVENPGAEHVHLSKIVQRAYLKTAENAAVENPKLASELRRQQLEIASNLAEKMTRAGQFIRAAQVLEDSVEGIIATANKIAQKQGRELTDKELDTLTEKGENLERTVAYTESAEHELAQIRREIERAKKQSTNLQNRIRNKEKRLEELPDAKKKRVVNPDLQARLRKSAVKIVTKNQSLSDMEAIIKSLMANVSLKMARVADDSTSSETTESAISEETLAQLSSYGAAILLQGKLSEITPVEFKERIKSTFGEKLEPFLDQIHAESLQKRRDAVRRARFERLLERIAQEEGNENLSYDELQDLAFERIEEQRRAAKLMREHAKAESEYVRNTPEKKAEKLEKQKETARTVKTQSAKTARKKAGPTITRLMRALAKEADTFVRISAAKMAVPEMTIAEFARQMKAEYGLDNKSIRELFRSGNEALNNARRRVQVEADKHSAIKNKLTDLRASEDEMLTAVYAARRERQKARAEIVNEFRKTQNRTNFYTKSTAAVATTFDVVRSVPTTMMASMDISGIMRQGGIAIALQPNLAPEFIKATLTSYTKTGFARNMDYIEHHKDFTLTQMMGVDYAFAGDKADHAQGEELFGGGKYIEKVPVIGKIIAYPLDRSDESYGGGLDRLRLELASGWATVLKDSGLTLVKHPEAYKAIGDWVNIVTGRGVIKPNSGSLTRATYGVLNLTSFAPKYRLSRLQFLTAPFNPSFHRLPTPARRLILKSWARYMGTIGLTLAALSLTGLVSVSFSDPDDDEWLKIKIGDTKLDMTSGLQPQARFMARLIAEGYRTVRGESTGGESAMAVTNTALSWARSGASPFVSLVADWWTQKTYTGKQFKWLGMEGALATRLLPLGILNTYNTGQKHGVATAIANFVPEFVGIGASTYPQAREKPKTKAEKLALKLNSNKGNKISSGRTDEDEEIQKQVFELTQRSRAGEDVESEVDALVNAGKIKADKGQDIIEAKDFTFLQQMTKRLTIPEAVRVYKLSNDKEQDDILDIIEEKADRKTVKGEMTDEDREALKSIGITQTQDFRKKRRNPAKKAKRPKKDIDYFKRSEVEE